VLFGNGDLGVRAMVDSKDEVGRLSHSFNSMASQLQSKFQEVESQRAFFEEVLDSLPNGVVVLDDRLIVRRANESFAGYLGKDQVDIAGKGIYEAAAGLAVLSDVIEDVRRTRKPFVSYSLPLTLSASNTENIAVAHWDVTIWPLSGSGNVRGNLILILSEVSKRVRAEKLATAAFAAERTRAAELESVINQMNEGVIIVDRHGRYKINVAGMKIIGREREMLRDGASALIEDLALRNSEGELLELNESPVWRALEYQESTSGEQYRIMAGDGEMRTLAISSAPLLSEAGEKEGAVAVIRDISDEVRQHGELVAAYDRLREHDRLKSAFVSNVTHELRTPLNVIIGLCQLLERDPQLPLAALQEDAVLRMERNAKNLLELVNDLIDYSRLEAGRSALKLEWLDVTEIVESVSTEYERAVQEKGIAIKFHVDNELSRVLSDKHKLRQVLSNLVGNAVKFTTSGSVRITSRLSGDKNWCLEVADTGIGISEDALRYIFDEFRQVDDRLTRSYGGTGLGLAITRKIVELLEGQIEVTSRPEQGSRFIVTWPKIIPQRTGTGSLTDRNLVDVSTVRPLRSGTR